MHTTVINQTRFHHNSDFSGGVIITVGDVQVEVPMEDLCEFVAKHKPREFTFYLGDDISGINIEKGDVVWVRRDGSCYASLSPIVESADGDFFFGVDAGKEIK